MVHPKISMKSLLKTSSETLQNVTPKEMQRIAELTKKASNSESGGQWRPPLQNDLQIRLLQLTEEVRHFSAKRMFGADELVTVAV
jgi:hypothetical protein